MVTTLGPTYSTVPSKGCLSLVEKKNYYDKNELKFESLGK